MSVPAAPRDAGSGVSRRTLAAGAAWSVPAIVVAGAAPAVAASRCDGVCTPYVIDWDRTSLWAKGVYTLPVKTGFKTVTGATSVRMTVTSSFSGAMKAGVVKEASTGLTYSENLTITDGTRDAGAAWPFGRAFQLHQQVRDSTGKNISTGSSQDAQTVVFAFSEPLCSLTFSLWDIDAQDYRATGYNDFADSVSVTSAAAYAVSRGANVTGAGTAASPLRSTKSADQSAVSSAASATLTFAGPVSSFTVRYWNSLPANYCGQPSVDGDQRIMVSDLNVGVWTRPADCP